MQTLYHEKWNSSFLVVPIFAHEVVEVEVFPSVAYFRGSSWSESVLLHVVFPLVDLEMFWIPRGVHTKSIKPQYQVPNPKSRQNVRSLGMTMCSFFPHAIS